MTITPEQPKREHDPATASECSNCQRERGYDAYGGLCRQCHQELYCVDEPPRDWRAVRARRDDRNDGIEVTA